MVIFFMVGLSFFENHIHDIFKYDFQQTLLLFYFSLENRFDRQEMIENEESNRNRDSTRIEQDIDKNTDEPEDYVYKKQLRYHDAKEQAISRKPEKQQL